MAIQNYTRIYDYIHEYQDLIYNFYSKHAVAFLTTYYNLDVPDTVWDDELLFGGPYEFTGDLSGVKRNKILLLPVYFIEEVTTAFDGQESGYNKENITSLVIPSSYGFIPYANDIIKLEQEYLRPVNDTYPVFQVSGVEISANTDRRFWKLKIETMQSVGLEEVEEQVDNVYSFVDYDKNIHTLEDSEFIAKLLNKDENLRGTLTSLYDQRTGFYYI
jgi:hypothetical protein